MNGRIELTPHIHKVIYALVQQAICSQHLPCTTWLR